jgi:hypothetical protein
VARLRRLPEQRGRLGDEGRRDEEGGPGLVGAEHREERLQASDLPDLEGEGHPAGTRDRADDLAPHPEPGESDAEGDQGEVTAQKAEGQGQRRRVAPEGTGRQGEASGGGQGEEQRSRAQRHEAGSALLGRAPSWRRAR